MSTRPSRVRWLLIFWMFVISAIAFLDRVNISIAGVSMERAYGFDTLGLDSSQAHSTGAMRSFRLSVGGERIEISRGAFSRSELFGGRSSPR